MKKQKAFTLAEVLITLGIIGVVAAMTMPSLMNNYRHKALETQFKKSVSIVSQAILNAKNDIGVDNFASYCIEYNGDTYNNSYECATTFSKAFNSLSKSSKWGNDHVIHDINRLSDTIKTYNGQQVVIGETTLAALGRPIVYTQAMADGSYINMHVNENMLYIGVDINGAKQPNKLGHDIFIFYVSPKNDVLTYFKPKNYTDEEIENGDFGKDYQIARAGNPCNKKSSQKGNGIGCAWYALRNECPDDATKSYFSCLP